MLGLIALVPPEPLPTNEGQDATCGAPVYVPAPKKYDVYRQYSSPDCRASSYDYMDAHEANPGGCVADLCAQNGPFWQAVDCNIPRSSFPSPPPLPILSNEYFGDCAAEPSSLTILSRGKCVNHRGSYSLLVADNCTMIQYGNSNCEGTISYVQLFTPSTECDLINGRISSCQGNVTPPEPEPEPTPSTAEVFQTMTDPAVKDTITAHLTEELSPTATSVTIGEPSIDGNFITWIITLEFDHELSVNEFRFVRAQIRSLIESELGLDASKVGLNLMHTTKS